MAPKKVSGVPLTAGEEPLTAVILADSFTQVACVPLVSLVHLLKTNFPRFLLCTCGT